MGILFLKACQGRCSDLHLWLAAWPWPPLRPTPTTTPTVTDTATAWATPAMLVTVLATLAMLDTLAMEVMVPDMALFLPLAHPLLLEPMPPQPPLRPSLFAATAPPPLLEPTSPTAMLPPATTGLTLLELSTLPRGLLSLSAATATDMDMGTEDPPALSPLESRLSLLLASPSKDMLRDTATATVMVMAANHHICCGLTRLSNYQITTRIENQV